MKKIFMMMCVMNAMVLFTSCEKVDNVDYLPGEIPGLGDAIGELTGTPYSLPLGVELTTDIYGGAEWHDYFTPAMNYTAFPARVAKRGKELPSKADKVTRAALNDEAVTVYRGSGYGYVDLYLSLHNTNSNTTTVEFPAGLILENVEGYCQNGVLLKKTVVQIPANGEMMLSLSFYCGNAHKGAAGSYDQYVLGVVTDAAPLIELCERVKNKKINIEEYDATSETDYYEYYAIVDMLQDIVWNVTDYEGLTEEDINYINSLPNSQ